MALQSKIWREAFDVLDMPDYPCPHCNRGTLRHRLKLLRDVKIETTAETRLLFSTEFECRDCNRTAVAIGYVRGDHGSYVIKGFHPAPPIIHIPSTAPRAVSVEIRAAFALFWIDLASCANKLRISVERTLDSLQIPALRNLNQRIDAYANVDANLADSFHALREVGNVGSHKGAPRRQTILHAFEIYENALRNIYDPNAKRMKALRAKIRASKGR